MNLRDTVISSGWKKGYYIYFFAAENGASHQNWWQKEHKWKEGKGTKAQRSQMEKQKFAHFTAIEKEPAINALCAALVFVALTVLKIGIIAKYWIEK